MKKIFLIMVGIMLSISINSFSATKKRATGKTQQTPQSVAVNFINGFFKALLEEREEKWIYNNGSVTQRYKNEYRNEIIEANRIAASCPGEICSGYPIIGEGGDFYTGKFKATNYNSSTSYVTVKPIQSFSNESYKIKVIKSNGKWMVDDVVPWWKEITY